MAQIIKIDGTTIKNPTVPVEIQRYALTKAGRTADGSMQLDFIAGKRTFQLEWDTLRSDDLNDILDIIEDFPTLFHTLTINENGTEASYTVYFGAVTRTPYRTDSAGYWYYKDIRCQAIER